MADPQGQQDWFASNAPIPTSGQTAQDWFASNAPSSPGQPPQKGAFRRFAERAFNLPSDLVEHPGAYLNPFSKQYWDKGAEERQQEKANPPQMHIVPPSVTQAHDDIKSGNYAGALGDISGDAMSAAQALGPFAGRAMSSPGFQRVFPKVGRYAGGALGYEAGREIGHPALGAAAGAGVGETVGRGVTAFGNRVGPAMEKMGLGSFVAPSPEVEAGTGIAVEPSPSPYRLSGDQIQDPVTVTPRRLFQPKALLTEGTPDVAAPAEPSPAPYRMKGNQIPDATTVTPKRVFQPAGLLTDGSTVAPAPRDFQLPAQAETQSPGGNLEFPRTNSGEGVLNQALTALDNKTLLKVARSRGINVTPEANLKPGVANQRIINKIIDDFSPDELDEIRNQGIEASRNKPLPSPGITPEQGPETWRYKVLSTYFPDVAIPKAMAARAQSVMANRPSVGMREFPQPAPSNPITDAISQATAKGEPVLPPESTGRTFSPNASGESPASLEAINRQASERANGVKRFRIDTRSGQETPLIGVDAVDAKAGPYDRIVQRGPQGETLLDQGPQARPPKQTPAVANNQNLEDVLQRATKGLRTFGATGGGDD